MSAPFAWSHRVSEIPEKGLRMERSASEAERAAVAAALDLPSCDEIKAAYNIRAIGGGRYRMSGEVRARITQRCVVTLEPLAERVEEPFDVEFRPPESIPEAADGEMEVLGAPEIEPIEQAGIDAGRVVFETLSAGLDPYPRKAGAAFDWAGEGEGAEPQLEGPFAALKKLRKGW